MTNIKVLGIALFAVFAFSAVAAASAFAESEWLFNGLAFTGELATNTVAELKLLVLGAGAVVVNEIDCSGLFEGTVTGGGPVDLVLDLFNLAGELIEELSGRSLTCETLTDTSTEGIGCKLSSETGSETLLWVDELSLTLGLTWESLIELMTTGPEFLLDFHNAAFELKCILLNGATLESLCSGLTSGSLANVAGGVLLTLNHEAPIESELLLCINKIGATEFESTVGLAGSLEIKHAVAGPVIAVS